MSPLLTLVETGGLGAAFMVALFYFGFGVTRFLLPPAFIAWRSLCVALVGLALLVVWDYVALFFGVNLTIATLALVVITTLVNGVAVVNLSRQRGGMTPPLRTPILGQSSKAEGLRGFLKSHCEEHSLRRSNLTIAQKTEIASQKRLAMTPLINAIRAREWTTAMVAACALVAFLLAIAPLVRYGYITLIGENWDYEFYLPLADALRTLPTAALAQAPANPLMNVVLSRHILPLPMGFAYLQASLDVLFRLEAFDSFTILLAVVRALGVIAPFIFFRATLKMSSKAALAATALLALNGLLLWATYWDYGLQLTSLALFPLALALGAHVLLTGEFRALPLAGLVLAALNVTFHPTLVAALLPLGALGLYVVVVKPDRVRTLAAGLGLIALTLALSFPTLFHIQDFLREYYGREPLATGLRDFVPLGDAYGLSQYTLDLVVGHTIPTPALFGLAQRIWDTAGLLLLLLALVASAYALWEIRHDKERRAVWYIVAGAGVFYVAIFRLPFLHPYPYGFLKSLTIVSFVLIALVVEGIRGWGLGIRGFEGRRTHPVPRRVSEDGGRTRYPRTPRAGCVGCPTTKDEGFFTRYVLRNTYFVVRSTYYLVSVALFAITLFTCGITLEQYFKPTPAFFTANDLQLRAGAMLLPERATVLLTDRGEVQKIPMALAAYVLRDFPLYGNVETGYGDLNNLTPGQVYDYALLARGEDPQGRGYEAQPLWSNNQFALYPRAPGVTYHRTLDARMAVSDTLTFSLGANTIVTGTQNVSPTVATRGVNLALASLVTRTVTLKIGDNEQTITLTPGFSLYQIPQVQVPETLTLTTQVAPDLNAATVRAPHELPRADLSLFVPWIELRDMGTGAERIEAANEVLVRCTSAGAGGLNARCFVANPGAVTLRWDYVVRGTPKGTEEDQELIRRTVLGSPRQFVELGANTSIMSIQFDALSPQQFAATPLPDGNYRAALEIFRGEVLLGRIDLYRFNLAQSGASLKRFDPSDPPLLIVQP